MNNKQKFDIALAAAGIPKPTKFSETKKHVKASWNGDQTMNASVIIDVLRMNDINYPDPSPNTNDTYFKVERATDTTVRTVLVMDRLNRKGYDAILDTATDEDGDGVSELEPATDEAEEIAETERKKEADAS